MDLSSRRNDSSSSKRNAIQDLSDRGRTRYLVAGQPASYPYTDGSVWSTENMQETTPARRDAWCRAFTKRFSAENSVLFTPQSSRLSSVGRVQEQV